MNSSQSNWEVGWVPGFLPPDGLLEDTDTVWKKSWIIWLKSEEKSDKEPSLGLRSSELADLPLVHISITLMLSAETPPQRQEINPGQIHRCLLLKVNKGKFPALKTPVRSAELRKTQRQGSQDVFSSDLWGPVSLSLWGRCSQLSLQPDLAKKSWGQREFSSLSMHSIMSSDKSSGPLEAVTTRLALRRGTKGTNNHKFISSGV